MPEEAITIACYPGQIPRFAERALENLYGSLYSSLPHLRLQGALDTADTYAAWRDDELVTLLLFRQLGRKIVVINEGMRLTGDDIAAFASYVFGKLRDASCIHFHAVIVDSVGSVDLGYPFLQLPCTEDIVIALPQTEEDYFASMGKSTRKNMRQSLARVQRSLPAFSHEVRQGYDVPEEIMRDIIGFNHARMASKQRASALNAEASDKLISLISKRGMVGMATVNGRLCGGTLACRFGDDLYSLVNAHDPAYDAFSLGSVCRHLMIADAIKMHAQRFHLLGGQFETKKMVLGKKQPLDHLVLYRSRVQQIIHSREIAQLGWRSAMYQAQTWLAHQASLGDKNLLSKTAALIFTTMRTLKRNFLCQLQTWRQSVRQ